MSGQEDIKSTGVGGEQVQGVGGVNLPQSAALQMGAVAEDPQAALQAGREMAAQARAGGDERRLARGRARVAPSQLPTRFPAPAFCSSTQDKPSAGDQARQAAKEAKELLS